MDLVDMAISQYEMGIILVAVNDVSRDIMSLTSGDLVIYKRKKRVSRGTLLLYSPCTSSQALNMSLTYTVPPFIIQLVIFVKICILTASFNMLVNHFSVV